MNRTDQKIKVNLKKIKSYVYCCSHFLMIATNALSSFCATSRGTSTSALGKVRIRNTAYKSKQKGLIKI